MAPRTAPPDPFEKLRRAREASGESVETVAARAGVDPGWLAGVEAGSDPGDEAALGLVGNALRISLDDLFGRKRRRTTPRGRTTTTRRSTTRSGAGDMDAAVRAAVRAEMAPLERLLRDLVAEVTRLRRAEEDTAARLGRLAAGAASGKKKAARKA
jgi:transcriptional regulator with XRE-family HTH domain